MTGRLDSLIALLTLESEGDEVFTGPPSNEPHVRSFGGQVVAQALVAAGMTVDRPAHSLHAYFLRPGRPNEPTRFEVERLRDGRSFANRQVDAVQGGQIIFRLAASFHAPETGIEHQHEAPKVADPESLPSFEDRFAGRDTPDDMGRWFVRARPFEIRYTNHTPFDPPQADHPRSQRVWVKTAEPIPGDPLLHQAIAAYASDLTILDAILLSHQMRWTDRTIMGASLDHAIWFHQPFRADQWLLFDECSPIAGAGHGLAEARIWTPEGRLAATIVQEGLLRPPARWSVI